MPPALNLLHELGFQTHGAKAVYFAIDVVIALDKTNVFHLGAHFDYTAGALELEIFNDGYRVAVVQFISGGITEYRAFGLGCFIVC